MVPVPAAHAAALEPLAGAGLAGVRAGGPRADRRSAERDGGAGRPRAPRFRRAAPRDPRGARARAGQRGPRVSPPRAGRTRSRLSGRRGAGAGSSSGPAAWIRGPPGCDCAPDQAFRPISRIGGERGLVLWQRALAAARAARPRGGRAGDAARPAGSGVRDAWETHWTSGGSKRWSPGGCSDSRPKCGCRGGHGFSSR